MCHVGELVFISPREKERMREREKERRKERREKKTIEKNYKKIMEKWGNHRGGHFQAWNGKVLHL